MEGTIHNLLMRQVEPARLEIVYCEHQEGYSKTHQVLFWLVLTRTKVPGPCISSIAKYDQKNLKI